MRHLAKVKWNGLKDKIKSNRKVVDGDYLLHEIINWKRFFYSCKDVKSVSLYESYLSRFDELDFSKFRFQNSWYDIDDLIEYDLLCVHEKTLEHIVINAGSLIWELIVYKSDRSCKNCDGDYLRVLVDKNRHVFFACDICSHVENLEGKKISNQNKLYPITPDIVNELSISPAPTR